VVVVVVVGFLPFNHTFTSHLCLAPLPRTFPAAAAAAFLLFY
jgi:hypothetical protein